MIDLTAIDWTSVLGPNRLGMDFDELAHFTQALQRHSRRSIRLRHPEQSHSLPFEVEAVAWNPRGRWLVDETVRPGAFLQYAAGAYYIQDAASMLALTLCDVHRGDWICDLCAAPGGKATGLAELLAGTGVLVANEAIASRIALLEMMLSQSGFGNYLTTNLNVDQFATHFNARFDCVLVDAPCSGQSMVGRQDQTLSAFHDKQIALNAARQQRILNTAARIVRPGGRIVYSTCTFAVAENENRVGQFLTEHPAWRLAEMPELARWSSPEMPGCYRLWPHRDGCDGAFAAALIFEGDCDSDTCHRKFERPFQRESRRRKPSHASWQPWRGKLAQLDWLTSTTSDLSGFAAWQNSQGVHLFLNEISSQFISVAHGGFPIADSRNGRLEPSYASAMAKYPALHPLQCLSLNDDQAIRYVAGESITLSDPMTPTGWQRIEWDGRSLGWGKLSGGVLKNHMPKLLRQPGAIA